MYSSATDRRALRTGLVCLLISLLCAVAGAVYEVFSHGVWSFFMVYAFLFPLMLDALPHLYIAYRRMPMPGKWVLNFHHAGVATLTVGCFVQGALDIYGTSHRLVSVYWVAGALLLLAALFVHSFRRRK